MSNQNPQDILNEILLRMRYDSSKTLSENKEIILEQGGSYYTPSGQLVGYPGTNNSNIPATKIYPNITNNKYPQQADYNKMQTALAGRNIRNAIQQKPSGIQTTQQTQIPTVNRNPKYQQLLRDYNLPTDLETKKDANAIIAGRLVSGEYEEFKNKLKIIYPEFYTKLQPKTVQKPKSNVGPKVDTRSYSDATRIAPGSFGTPGQELASDEQMAVLKFMTPKKVDAGFNSEFEVPGTSKLYYWDENDHNDVKLFSNSVTFKNGSLNDWTFFIISGNKYQKDYVMPISKVKGFSFNYKSVDLTFKRTVTSDEFLNEFGTIIDGKYYKYVKSDFLSKTFWEENGPIILNLASLSVAVLGPATWPLLLISAGLDLAAAKIQYEQGDKVGAELSVLLSLTPFLGKFGIKVPKSDADNLAKKFINAKTTSDVDLIISNLSKTELSTLKSLRELGDINKITSMVNDPQVKSAIKLSTQKSKGLAKVALQKGATELGLGAGIVIYKFNDLKAQEIENLKRSQVFNKIKEGILESTNLKSFMTDEEKQTISEDISEILPLNSMIEKMIQQSDIIRRSYDKSIKKSTNDILIKQKNTIDDIDKQIKFLEEQNNKLKELGDSKLSEEEKNQLTN
jgi:hypothetical protein